MTPQQLNHLLNEDIEMACDYLSENGCGLLATRIRCQEALGNSIVPYWSNFVRGGSKFVDYISKEDRANTPWVELSNLIDTLENK